MKGFCAFVTFFADRVDVCILCYALLGSEPVVSCCWDDVCEAIVGPCRIEQVARAVEILVASAPLRKTYGIAGGVV